MSEEQATIPVEKKSPVEFLDESGWGMSETTSKLFAAMSKARGEMGNLITSKTADAGRYTYTFATLADCWEVIQKPLSDNGLVLTQLTLAPQQGARGMGVRTILGHSSGEWIASTTWMPAAGTSAQDAGSALTYARRYALVSIIGLYQEDDDGAAASGKEASVRDKRSGPKDSSKGGGRSKSNKAAKEGWPKKEGIPELDLELQMQIASDMRAAEAPIPPEGLMMPEGMPPFSEWFDCQVWTSDLLKDYAPIECFVKAPGSVVESKLAKAREMVLEAAKGGKSVSHAAYLPVWILGVIERWREEKKAEDAAAKGTGGS